MILPTYPELPQHLRDPLRSSSAFSAIDSMERCLAAHRELSAGFHPCGTPTCIELAKGFQLRHCYKEMHVRGIVRSIRIANQLPSLSDIRRVRKCREYV